MKMLLTSAAMPLVFVTAVAGLTLLYFGGEALVAGAAGLARRLGVSPLAVGLTVVAFGTSAPELAVSLDAALTGANDIAVGNVVGSNISNIALILGGAALLKPLAVHARVIALDAPLMLLAAVVLMLMLSDGALARHEGLLLGGALIGYVAFTLYESRRETRATRDEFEAGVPHAHRRVLTELGLIAGGLAGLVGGGHLLVGAAVAMAGAFGVSEAVIGLTVVAVGTSLPELATSLVAARRDQGDIAIGNIVGSNIFNVLGILGITACVTPLARGGVGWGSLWTMLAASVLVLPLLYTRRRLERHEGAGLLAGYSAYVGWLVLAG